MGWYELGIWEGYLLWRKLDTGVFSVEGVLFDRG
jgi:hypothetical protein